MTFALQKVRVMSNKTRSMNKVKIILQSIENGMTIKGVSRSHGVSKNTIKGYIKKIRDDELSTSMALELNDESLEKLLYKTKDRVSLSGDFNLLYALDNSSLP